MSNCIDEASGYILQYSIDDLEREAVGEKII